MSAPHRLKEIRESRTDESGKKLSGIKIAKMLGITPQYYYDIERGDRTLSSDMASQLSDILRATTDYILNKTDVNLYDWTLTPSEEKEEITLKEDPSPYTTGTEPSKPVIKIEELTNHKLTYKGHELTEDQKAQLTKILQAAADMLK